MADLRFVTREPDKAYVSDMLWLPKSLVAEKAIKDSLQFWDVEKGEAILRKLWSETGSHIICPREYIRPEQYPAFPFPFVDMTPTRFPRVHIWVKNQPRNDDQKKALEAFEEARAGILNLACGKGKTFLALKRIESLGCPLLVVVHNTFLMNQWVNEALPVHVELPPNERVGIIQGPTFDWQHPITVAMIHSLAKRVSEGKIPPEFRRWFGAVVFDEVHHLSAPLFAQTAPIGLGYRYGLTATDKRVDATDFIYKYHLGDIFYSDLVQKLIPRIYFQQTPTFIDLGVDVVMGKRIPRVPETRDVRGEIHLRKLGSYMGQFAPANQFRAACIQEALSQGRKILCISNSKIQLINLHEMFPGSGLVVQEMPQAERSNIVRKSQLSFAISNLGSEGLDDDSLDTIFVLLPMGSKDAPPNEFQQIMGRAQRDKEGRNHPVIVIFDDVRIKPLHSQCRIMRKALEEWDKHVNGMPTLSYTTLSVPHFP